jgi:hypothetical protein
MVSKMGRKKIFLGIGPSVEDNIHKNCEKFKATKPSICKEWDKNCIFLVLRE